MHSGGPCQGPARDANPAAGGVAAGLGLGLSPSSVVVTQVCEGTQCDVIAARRELLQASTSTDIVAKFMVVSNVSADLVRNSLSSAGFSSLVALSVSSSTGRNVTSRAMGVSDVECAAGFYFSDTAGCVKCTQCGAYALHCTAKEDAICLVTSVNLSIVIGAALAGVIVVVGASGMSLYLLKQWRAVRATSKFLALHETAQPKEAATIQHFPYDLQRLKLFAPVNIVARGTFGVVILCESIKKVKRRQSVNGSLKIRRSKSSTRPSTNSAGHTPDKLAIKIIVPSGAKGFHEREQRALKREFHVLKLLKEASCEQAVHLVTVASEPFNWDSSGKGCWFVMEYLDGENVESFLRRVWETPEQCGEVDISKECIKVSRNVLAVLKVMHSKGFVHRDIKPANIMRYKKHESDTEWNYKLIDFGTALGIDETLVEREHMTVQSGKKECDAGTRAYMSPEMYLEAERADYRSDLWSLGVSMFEMVTGKLPFDAPSEHMFAAVIAGDLDKPAPSVLDCLPDEGKRAVFDHNLAKVIAKALEKKVRDRFQTSDEMHEAVYECLVAKGEAFYSAFISYRVASEAPLARILFDELNHSRTPAGHRVTVYWDAFRLVKGEDWEEGFSTGLLNSVCVFPIMSYGSTAPLAALPEEPNLWSQKVESGWEERPVGRPRLRGDDGDPEDNVLKEWMITKVLMDKAKSRPARGSAINDVDALTEAGVSASASEEVPGEGAQRKGLLQKVYPILMGRLHPPNHSQYPRMGSFFSVAGGGGTFPARPSPRTNAAVERFLKQHANFTDEESQHVQTITVSDVVQGITKMQGCQLWNKVPPELTPGLELTKEQADSLVGKGCAGPPANLDGEGLTHEQRQLIRGGGLDLQQLLTLKDLVRAKLRDFHDVIDLAMDKHNPQGLAQRAASRKSINTGSDMPPLNTPKASLSGVVTPSASLVFASTKGSIKPGSPLGVQGGRRPPPLSTVTSAGANVDGWNDNGIPKVVGGGGPEWGKAANGVSSREEGRGSPEPVTVATAAETWTFGPDSGLSESIAKALRQQRQPQPRPSGDAPALVGRSVRGMPRPGDLPRRQEQSAGEGHWGSSHRHDAGEPELRWVQERLADQQRRAAGEDGGRAVEDWWMGLCQPKH